VRASPTSSAMPTKQPDFSKPPEGKWPSAKKVSRFIPAELE